MNRPSFQPRPERPGPTASLPGLLPPFSARHGRRGPSRGPCRASLCSSETCPGSTLPVSFPPTATREPGGDLKR